MTRTKQTARLLAYAIARQNAALTGPHKSTPEIRARAAAEWAAMDDWGRLPDGWEYEG